MLTLLDERNNHVLQNHFFRSRDLLGTLEVLLSGNAAIESALECVGGDASGRGGLSSGVVAFLDQANGLLNLEFLCSGHDGCVVCVGMCGVVDRWVECVVGVRCEGIM